ncbi:ATP-binding protein [Streptomyces sp. NPDC003717]|uniref:ATP-binding protein n=1 Tax=Streptomyces sp. NPDC003717 TaxID=3154276 RepID=UPI0033A3CAA2
MKESAERGRRLVRTALAAWHLDALTDSGILLVSELVANAVRHTDSHAIRVVVTRPADGLVRIGVTDKSRALPVPRPDTGDVLRTSGMGLLLVEATADRWGTDLRRWGKHVWAELRVEDQS